MRNSEENTVCSTPEHKVTAEHLRVFTNRFDSICLVLLANSVFKISYNWTKTEL